jgi:DNA modification methylase
MEINTILQGNSLEILKNIPDKSIQTCITSPPYWGLRDYGTDEQLGLEETPEQYVENMVLLFREVRRVLKDDGTLWLNLGDSYSSVHTGGKKSSRSTVGSNHENAQEIKQPKAKPSTYGLKEKELVGIPWRVAFALQADGWYLRQDIIWHKPNPMPESVTDRCTKSHEYIFLMTKSAQYYYDHEAIMEKTTDSYQGKRGKLKHRNKTQSAMGDRVFNVEYTPEMTRNKRSVWTIPTRSYKEAHFAVFPDELIKPCILAGSAKGDIVLDPFFGSGTTGLVALRSRRNFIGIELNSEYISIANKRLKPYLLQNELF